MTDFKSIARIALYTFLGAFFASLVVTGIPTTLADAKILVAPAFMAGLAAEIVYLRKVFSKALADAAAGALGPKPESTPAIPVQTVPVVALVEGVATAAKEPS